MVRQRLRLGIDLIRMQPVRGCALCQPANPALANHVHRFDTLNRWPGRVKCTKALHRFDPAFSRPMILLYHVVEIANGSTAAVPTELSSALQLLDGTRIGRIPIYIDDPWTRMVW